MRITNSNREQNINLTKCTKMTEEEYRVYGMNGVTNSGKVASKEDSSQNTDNYSQGGRLKFFKNGKFILELARAREGEKVAWVPVPKKTFWPPQGSASSVTQYRQESSTSLSVSDDNSSVQSSPWQRDHTWKQSTPTRNTSNHMSFFYKNHLKKKHRCASYHLKRRPYATIYHTSDKILNSERTKCIMPGIKCNRCLSVSPSVKRQKSLIQIVQRLWNKSLHVMNNITSPRKRILRELERVTIDDLSYKRCRGKVNHVLPVTTAHPTTITTEFIDTNGSSVEESNVKVTATTSKNCSYSITSLLSGKNDRREDKSSQFVPVPRMTHQTLKEEPSYDTTDSPRIDIMSAGSKRSAGSVVSAGYQPATSYHPYVSPYVYSPSELPVGYVSSYYSPYGRAGFVPMPIALPRPNGSLYSWPTYQQPTRDDNISDVPLNLSKHAD